MKAILRPDIIRKKDPPYGERSWLVGVNLKIGHTYKTESNIKMHIILPSGDMPLKDNLSLETDSSFRLDVQMYISYT